MIAIRRPTGAVRPGPKPGLLASPRCRRLDAPSHLRNGYAPPSPAPPGIVLPVGTAPLPPRTGPAGSCAPWTVIIRTRRLSARAGQARPRCACRPSQQPVFNAFTGNAHQAPTTARLPETQRIRPMSRIRAEPTRAGWSPSWPGSPCDVDIPRLLPSAMRAASPSTCDSRARDLHRVCDPGARPTRALATPPIWRLCLPQSSWLCPHISDTTRPAPTAATSRGTDDGSIDLAIGQPAGSEQAREACLPEKRFIVPI